jgi:hypothetical protein
MALCEGTIQGIGTVWQDKTLTTLGNLNLTLFTGTASQEPWSFVASMYPTQSLAYAYTAYLASPLYQLGSSPDLPNHNFEVIDKLSGSMPGGVKDANLGDIIPDYLTNPQYSFGFPSEAIDATTLALFKNYQQAQKLFFSPNLYQQEQATQTFQRWAQLANSWIFWSGTLLKFVPLGDTLLTGDGTTYTPYLEVVYNLTYDDFIFKKGADPITVTRSDPTDGYNKVQIDCNDRGNSYNNTTVLWQDQSSIDQYGQLMAQTISATEIQEVSVAQLCAYLIGKRSVYIRNTYNFTLGYNYVLLEPGDIVTLTDPNIGLNAFAVRITNVKENKDSTLEVTAEELPVGIGSTSVYSNQTWAGNPATDTNVAPGNVNTPAIFEPDAQLCAGVPEVWVAASGGADWGGAQVYISFDDTSYTYLSDINAGEAQGILTATLPSHADPDTTNSLLIDLTECAGQLPSTATDADADALRTLILVDAELMAYGSVTPTSGTNPFAFTLTYLRRGSYNTAIASHAVGGQFSRIDPSTIFSYPVPESYIGKTIYLKFVSFNVFGSAYQDLADVTAYPYIITGNGYAITAPASPAGAVSSTTQSDGTTLLTITTTWTASPGPNLGGYNIEYSTNGGTTWSGGTSLPATATSYTLTPALASTSYLFRVQAVSTTGNFSAFVTTSAIATGSLVTAVPAAPSGLAAASLAGGALLSYTLSTSASTKGYQASYGTTNVFSSATLYSVTSSGPGLVVAGLSPGVEYYVWIQAYNGAGASPPDGPVTVTPTATGSGSGAYQQGSLTSNGTLTIAQGPLTLTGADNGTLSMSIEGYSGSLSLGGFIAIDFGSNELVSIVTGTLDLSGLAPGIFYEGTNYESLALSGITASVGTSTPETLTLSTSGGTVVGSIGVEYDGTIFPTLVAGPNITLTPGTESLAGQLTVSASTGGGGGGSIVFENNGTSVGSASTINLAPGIYTTISGGVATIILGSPASAAYLYWRFYCTRNSGAPGGNIAFSEIQFDTGTGSFVVPTGGAASASSDYSTSVNEAFDGNIATFWASSGANVNDWIQYEFASPIGFSRIQFSPRDDAYATQGPISIVIQGSNDGSTFTNLVTFTPSAWYAGVNQIATI